MTNKITSEDVYTQEVGDLYDEADISINPVSRELLLDLLSDNGVGPDSLVLDIGCANGGLSRKLLDKVGCTIEGVELLPFLVDMGNKQNAELDIDPGKFKIQLGSITNIPFPDNHFDFVFCSDVIGLVEDLDAAFRECARVLKSKGKALFYATSFKTERLSSEEEKLLATTLGTGGEGLYSVGVAEVALQKYFTITEKQVIGSQFGQHDFEKNGESDATKGILKVGRLLTEPDKYIEKYGEKVYRIVLAEAMWSPFIMLGKLEPTLFIVQRV